MAQQHSDLEFHLHDDNGDSFGTYRTFEDGLAAASRLSAGLDHPVTLDVLIWSEDGARAWGSEEGVEQFLDDPEASVFDRLEVSVRSLGKIP